MRRLEDRASAELRWRDLRALQKHYDTFDKFLVDVIEDVMGFTCTDIQLDIGYYLEHGPKSRMIQAQRGQAKTTITAAYAVWRLIHDPTTRVLIVSAGEDMATQISNWIIQILTYMPELECMRPDKAAGDRTSIDAYDVHHSLKGAEKSPSIACLGVTANLQGFRADLLIADDIESGKNSRTAAMRAILLGITRDFTSICSTGDIVYLGTPQSIDSVYNTLPARGYDIRIWPGRYPTAKELPTYAGMLAPLLLARIQKDPSLQTGGGADGSVGKPVDPVLLNERVLQKKIDDQGAAYFQLQHMLCTAMSDMERFPLKVGAIRFCAFDVPQRMGPMAFAHIRTDQHRVFTPAEHPLKDPMYRVTGAEQHGLITDWAMYIDSSGGGSNGDELAYAVGGTLASRIFIPEVSGMPGGITEERLDALIEVIKRWKPKQIWIEKNFGNGALATVLRPKLVKAGVHCGVEDDWVTGQKELRIIDQLEPVLGAGKLVMAEELVQADWESTAQYPAEKRSLYSLFFQIARITRERNALVHEDRLDALASLVGKLSPAILTSEDKAKAAAKKAAWEKLIRDPLGNGRPIPINGKLPSLQPTKPGMFNLGNRDVRSYVNRF